MKLLRRFRSSTQSLARSCSAIDPASLQFRMAAGVTLLSVLGIVGVSGWMSWRTQQILIGSHKQQIADLAERLPEDIALYRESMTPDEAIQKAVTVRSLPDVSIVIRDGNAILAQSDTAWHSDEFIQSLIVLPKLSLQPDQFQLNDRHYLGCQGPLVVEGETIGQMAIALDITESTLMFSHLMGNLALATILAIALITVAIALYVRQSVRPLRRISQITADLTVDDLEHVQFHLEQAPTEVRELAQTCEMTLMRLAESLNQQRQFVHDISHELRTPLTVVYGYLQSTLRRCQNLTDPQREALQEAATEAERTIRILQEMLELARLESDSLKFSSERIHLNSFVEESLTLIRLTHSHPVELEIARPDVEAIADPNQLKQVLFKLVENAIRYSPPHQAVTIKLDQSSNGAIIQVCDRGVGIPPQHQSRIFDRCYRVDEARARSTGGCGLGLSIVKALINGMHGSISVCSQPEKGSVFTITLPSPQTDHDSEYRSRRRRRKVSPIH